MTQNISKNQKQYPLAELNYLLQFEMRYPVIENDKKATKCYLTPFVNAI